MITKVMALDTYNGSTTRTGAERIKIYFDCLADCGFSWDEAAWDETALTGVLRKYMDENHYVGLELTCNTSTVFIRIVTSEVDTNVYFQETSSVVFRTVSIAYDNDNLTVTFTQNTGFPNQSAANTVYLFFGKSTNRKNGDSSYMAGICYVTPTGGNNNAFLDCASYFVDTATLLDSVHSSAVCSMCTDRTARYLVTRDICGFTDSVADKCRLIISDTESHPNQVEWISLNNKMYYRNGLFLMAEEDF